MAADINSVAWFILRCTLHYPRLLAGETGPLPPFGLGDRGFVEEFLKAHGVTKANAVREGALMAHPHYFVARMFTPETTR